MVCQCDEGDFQLCQGDLDGVIAVECVNRFETHFLNIAADAVQYCKDVGNKNMKVHLDCFHMIREEKKLCGRGKRPAARITWGMSM